MNKFYIIEEWATYKQSPNRIPTIVPWWWCCPTALLQQHSTPS